MFVVFCAGFVCFPVLRLLLLPLLRGTGRSNLFGLPRESKSLNEIRGNDKNENKLSSLWTMGRSAMTGKKLAARNQESYGRIIFLISG